MMGRRQQPLLGRRKLWQELPLSGEQQRDSVSGELLRQAASAVGDILQNQSGSEESSLRV